MKIKINKDFAVRNLIELLAAEGPSGGEEPAVPGSYYLVIQAVCSVQGRFLKERCSRLEKEAV